MLRVGVVAERHAGRERYYRLEREALEEVGGGLGASTSSGPAGSGASANGWRRIHDRPV